MRYLLDTNAYIYWATDQDLLDVDVYDLLNADKIVVVKAAMQAIQEVYA